MGLYKNIKYTGLINCFQNWEENEEEKKLAYAMNIEHVTADIGQQKKDRLNEGQ